ncbi:MAG TPA: hypothetical protein VG389_24585 [Myxococcota bacterium]|nr:hypothetical protein [Myxococcota bacterium]
MGFRRRTRRRAGGGGRARRAGVGVAADAFEKRRDDWIKTRPAWESDDDEYARWLAVKDPSFFAHNFPPQPCARGWLERAEMDTKNGAPASA